MSVNCVALLFCSSFWLFWAWGCLVCRGLVIRPFAVVLSVHVPCIVLMWFIESHCSKKGSNDNDVT